ncbi:hypothetical protein [Aquisalimonas sp.]|nr:hypothetical protein [Aquisalimonas sp.]
MHDALPAARVMDSPGKMGDEAGVIRGHPAPGAAAENRHHH